MKRTLPLVLAAALFVAVGCSNSSDTPATASQPASVAPTSTSAPAGEVALNPAHGLPGHRCDIEVGAPLNSAPAPNLQMPQLGTPSGQVAPPQPGRPQAQPAVQAGLNPPHGQPGHDCAVPVGQPLNR
ncbi:hypothetical protein [Cesiribacter andamanensis]|uniref:hypothetical protein n=1 Tax=Cesiribacter andamanensis TaxID=649507 RepID=UPI000344FFE0|nr:hypothetical protein [Cesiribacter andamanensis]